MASLTARHENMQNTARELVDRCPHFGAVLQNRYFIDQDRRIQFWRVNGKICLYMQGRIARLPAEIPEPEPGMQLRRYYELSELENLEEAVKFLQAWLVEGREVDDLPFPGRYRKRYGIA